MFAATFYQEPAAGGTRTDAGGLERDRDGSGVLPTRLEASATFCCNL